MRQMAKGREGVRTLVGTVLAVVVAGWSVPATSQTGTAPECGPFTVETRVEKIRFVDLDPVGKGIGDYRVGTNGLYDGTGARVGTSYFRSTVIPSPETGVDMVLATLVHAFANGTIATTVLAQLDDAGHEAHSTRVKTFQAITGGTEAFSGAHGSATLTTGEGGARMIAFDISCD
jgi:hypothetical protein